MRFAGKEKASDEEVRSFLRSHDREFFEKGTTYRTTYRSAWVKANVANDKHVTQKQIRQESEVCDFWKQIRYGDDPLIRELYSDWNIIDASSRDQCNKVKGEIWITNAPSGVAV